MELQFAKTGDSKRWLRASLVGPPGTGKTTIAAGFPQPLFILPRNEGSDAVLGPGFHKIVVGSHVIEDAAGVKHRATRPPMQHMMQVLDQLLLWQQEGVLATFCQTVVVEQLSHYSKLVENELTQDGQISMSGANGGRWPAFQAHFNSIVEKLFRLDAHVVMTMHDQVKVVRDQVIGHQAAIAGATANNITSSCDLLGYCEVEGALHTTYFTRRGSFYARHRLPGLGTAINNFNFAEHLAPLL